MAASSIHCIFTESRDHIDEGLKNTHELPRVSFAKSLKIRRCHAEGRQLESLHFIESRDHLDGGKTRSNKKNSNFRSFFCKAVF